MDQGRGGCLWRGGVRGVFKEEGRRGWERGVGYGGAGGGAGERGGVEEKERT